MLNIPIIDISSLPGDSSVIGEIAHASEELGCFHIIDHSIPEVLTRNFFEQMHAFFGLSRDDKQRLSRTAENPWGYYDRELTKNRQDWKEIFDYGIDQADGEFSSTSQWPSQLEEFRPVMMEWFRANEMIASRLLSALCTALGLSADTLAREFGPGHSSFMRLNYYPRCDDPAEEGSPTEVSSGHLGISHHTDAGALTVLAHDEVPALQILYRDEWHTVAPHPKGLFINVGDMIQVWSNDRFKAPQHRVIANQTQERFSAPFFYNPLNTTVCRPIVTQPGDEPARYRDVPWGEYRRRRAQGDYANYGEEVQIAWYRR